IQGADGREHPHCRPARADHSGDPVSGLLEPHTIGTSLPRIDGIAKVTGTAPYAYEQPVTDPLYLHPVQATIARGRVTAIDSALASAAVRIDQTYTTPMEHNNPMEPHTTVAIWERTGETGRLTLYDSTQGVFGVRNALAPVFGLDPECIRVVAPYVGGGFGS